MTDDARQAIDAARRHAEELIERAERLAALADDLIEETEFGFLFNPERQLFSIGFSVSDGRLDNSYYDTLASEARLASFMAIALGQDVARALVQARAVADADRQRARAAVVERVDVRVPDAAAGDALVSGHAARRNLQRGGPAADSSTARSAACPGASPSRPTTRRTSRGTISTARSACPGSASSAASPTISSSRRTPRCWPRRSRRATCSTTSSGCGTEGMVGPARLLRGDRLHARAAAAGPQGRRRAAHLHGAPPGHEPARARQPAERRRRCSERFHADPRVQAADLLLQERIPQLVPLKNPPVETAEHVPSSRRRGRAAGAPLRDAAHAQPARAPAVERLVHGDGHQRRRRLQPAAAPRDDALARGHHHRRSGAASASSATSTRARSGRRRTSRAAATPTTTK